MTSRPRLSAGRLLAAMVAALLLAGCSGVSGVPTGASEATGSATATASHPAAPSAETSSTAPDRTSTELIATALQARDIDEPTSLLYRTWAQFNEPALPEVYRGAREPHDLGLFVELTDGLDELPDDVRSQVEPYLRRPSDPDSAFSAGGADEPPGLRSPAGPARHATAVAGRECAEGWDSLADDAMPFRVWACLDGGVEAAVDAQLDVLAVLEEHSGDMIGGMGPPREDDPAYDTPNRQADERTDFYVLPRGWIGPDRLGGPESIGAAQWALTIPSYPRVGGAAPGYVLLDAGTLGNDDLLAHIVVHELFHVLQFAHHYDLDSRWFYEASAVWAEVHYLPATSASVHERYLSPLQNSSLPLHAERPTDHPYAAYLWPLFMQQQAGADAIFATWADLESAPAEAPASAVLDAIDRQVDVGASFGEFAMRLFNATVPGDPIRPRFVDLDPNFPDGQTPQGSTATLGDDPLRLDHSRIPGLGYRYTQVEVPGSAEAPVLVRARGDLAAGSGEAIVESLVRSTSGDYRRQRIQLSGDGTNLCVGGALVLVVSNPSMRASDATTGGITLERAGEPDEGSGCGLTGDLRITFDAEYHSPPDQIPIPDRGKAHWTGTLALNLGSPVPSEFDFEPDYHPNIGSHWSAVGHFEFERCIGSSADPCIGAFLTRQGFSADTALTESEAQTSADADEGWSVTDSRYVRIDLTDDGPVLRTSLPVQVTTTAARPNLPEEKSTATTYWSLTCPADGKFWRSGTFDDQFVLPEADDLTGTWNDTHTALTFDCTSSWQPTTYDGGSNESGSVTVTITGTLHSG